MRKTHAVDITILDESQQPVPDVTLAFQEFEVVPFIPLMPFGPARKILYDRTATTDKQGKVRFDVKYYTTVANSVSRAGIKLKVTYSETIDSSDNRSRRSFPGQLPQWDVGSGFPDPPLAEHYCCSPMRPHGLRDSLEHAGATFRDLSYEGDKANLAAP
jgi:hypothetical protein